MHFRTPISAMARQRIFAFFITTTCCFALINREVHGESKLYYGQRIFTDVHIVNFVDPAKHGFHVILDDDFVKSYLQPVHLPTVYASAISLKLPEWKRAEREKAVVKNKTVLATSSFGPTYPSRVTKILYPEKGDPENGLLDGRTIKLLGLQERSWYYVCVEFESNVNRHELATGTSCQLRRTLDKFGKTVESTISEIELTAVTDRSLAIQVVVDVDFPMRLEVYLTSGGNEDSAMATADVPVQAFVVKRSQTLNIDFGPFLQADTAYGSLCILEEPLPSSNSYTPMGRSVKAHLEHCYFNDLKTKPAEKQQRSRESGLAAQLQTRHVGERAAAAAGGACVCRSYGTFMAAVYFLAFMTFGARPYLG